MAIDTDKLKRETDLVEVVGHYTKLTKRGKEFVGRCVAHDDATPSMTVNQDKGFVHCFGCGFHADVIAFIQEVEGLEFIQAAEFLGAKNDWQPKLALPAKPELPVQERITVKPPLGSRPKTLSASFEIDGERVRLEPALIWDYKDANGDLLGVCARYNLPDRKEFRMWTYANDAWGIGAFSYPRPLYNLDKLATNESPVLVVEGEKCADAAAALIPQYTATTWTNGANSLKKTDLSPLKNKKVILMPDNDDAGREAMMKLAEILIDPQGLNCTVKIIDTSEMSPKWDIADAYAEGWTSEQFIAWAKQHISEYNPKHPEYLEKVEEEQRPVKKPELTIVKTPARTVADGNTIKQVPETSQEVEVFAIDMSPDFFMQKFIDYFGDDWRHIRAWGKWLFWNGDTWVTDRDNTYFDEVRALIRKGCYWDEARSLTDSQKSKLTHRSFIGGVTDLISSSKQIRTVPEMWDADNMKLGIPSGVIDLNTGNHMQGAREQLISRQVLVKPEAGDCPHWISSINRATGGSLEMLEYLQRVAGYIITGETREECFFFVYGPGASGKSTFCRVLTEIMNDYAQSASMDAFMAKQNQEHLTEIARMAGARLVVATETDEGARWNESRIKALTGRDKISARFMRGDLFDFQPTAKILIAGNHKPQLRSVGEEMKRRIHLIDFPTTIPESERDRRLNEKLKAEYPQILNWMIEGAVMWNKLGLKRPESVLAATNEYLADEDSYSAWISEYCTIGTDLKVSANVAFHSYQKYCADVNEYCPNLKRFTQRLVDKGFHRIKTGGLMLGGLEVKETEPDYTRHYYD
jgi:putative DNA primase/helicase